MERSMVLIDACGIILTFFFGVNFGGHTIPLAASTPQQPPELPKIIVGSPQAGEDWPTGTSQSIRWAKNFSTTQGLLSDAKVKVELVGEAGSQELLLDDGRADATPELDNKIIVLRLTPPSYPATLEAIRILVPTIQGQSDRERTIKLYYVADEQGRGSPPDVAQFPQPPPTATVRSTGSFMDIPIRNGPSLRSGDFYIGYEIEAPAGGFTYPIDRSNTQRRSFIADSGGDKFTEAEFPDPNQPGGRFRGNLMVRARVNVSATRIPLSPIEGVDNTGEFCWRVKLGEGQEPMTGSERRSAKVRVSAVLNGEEVASGTSDQFTISRALQTLTVASPSSGEIWRHKEERLIKWTSERMIGDVRIELLHFIDFDNIPDEVFCLFDGEDVSKGGRLWEVGPYTPGFYKIKISSSLDSRIFDESDLFVILERLGVTANAETTWEDWAPFAPATGEVESSSLPCTSCRGASNQTAQSSSIQVVTPNGGEVFLPGDRVKITWGSQGVQGNVRIVLYDLSKNVSNPEVINLFEQSNTGSADWITPFRLSDALKIGILSVQNPNVADVSDGVFAIGIPGQGRIRILMPSGGEEFQIGSETHIMWVSEGNDVGATVRVDISFDGGISWQRLCFPSIPNCRGITNNGDFRWGIDFPNMSLPQNNVKLRIVSETKPWISDVTSCSFRIIAPVPPDPNAPKCPEPRR
ncbi:MAG: hypothetical protein HY314_00130 [Acidobacteria bacterium]|nr:hypothetical protein [Acidobacteriota bacterium]